MLNRSASLVMSTSVLKALPGKLDFKRHSPSILYLAISADPDEMPPNAAFHLALYCFPKYCLSVSRMKRAKYDQSSAFTCSECQRINQFIRHVNQACTSELNRVNF